MLIDLIGGFNFTGRWLWDVLLLRFVGMTTTAVFQGGRASLLSGDGEDSGELRS